MIGQETFGQFEAQQMRREACLLQDLRDIVREIRMPDLCCRYVYRDFPSGFTCIQPGFRLKRRLSQDPEAEIADELGALRDRYEFGRRNITKRGMVPAHQSLEASDPAVRQRNLRLIVHGQANVLGDRPAQFARDCDLVLDGRIHSGLKENQTTTTAFLGAVQSKIGIALKVVQIPAVAGNHRNANACPNAYLAAVEEN